jgi:hypothetical protein
MTGISSVAFADEFVKIAGLGKRLVSLGRKSGLLETDADAAMRLVRKTKKDVPGASPQAHAQLKKMKLQRQLAEMKKARGLA